jgi:hypothetical protein
MTLDFIEKWIREPGVFNGVVVRGRNLFVLVSGYTVDFKVHCGATVSRNKAKLSNF